MTYFQKKLACLEGPIKYGTKTEESHNGKERTVNWTRGRNRKKQTIEPVPT
jgi:hypothetical protein